MILWVFGTFLTLFSRFISKVLAFFFRHGSEFTTVHLRHLGNFIELDEAKIVCLETPQRHQQRTRGLLRARRSLG